MASSRKKRVVVNDENIPGEDEMSDADSEDDVTDESENEFMDQEVQVQFEARPPEDSDFHGIRSLMQQLFLKFNINVSDLVDIIISQNYVGAVLKQVDEDEDDDDDDAMDDDGGSPVFGIVTAVNITDKQGKECIKQLISLVTSQCESKAPAEAAKVKEILHNPQEHVGFLISERMINIPAQISVPSFLSLKKDLEKACRKKMKYAFSHFLMLCKTYRLKATPAGSSPSLFYTNGEEELVAEMSDIQVTWSVADERDGVADGRWDEDDMEATRTLLLFSADKLDSIITKLQTELAT